MNGHPDYGGWHWTLRAAAIALSVDLAALVIACATPAILNQPKTPEEAACGRYYVECRPPPHWACCSEGNTCRADGTCEFTGAARDGGGE